MDSTLTIERIQNALDTTYGDLVDMSDVSFEPAPKRRSMFLSRALAAFAVRALTDADPSTAAAAITDGRDDQGLDAIYIDSDKKIVYIVQSKWASPPDQGDVEKFLTGLRALIRAEFRDFNERIRKRETELKTQFLYRSDHQVVVVLAYLSTQSIGEHAERQILQYVDEQNNVGELEVFSRETFDLKRLYGHISGSPHGQINIQIALREWGQVQDPYCPPCQHD